MPKFFVKNNQIKDDLIFIHGEDVNHISNVLRMQVGSEIIICDVDTANNYLVKIENISKTEIICSICETLDSVAESNVEVDIYQGLPKSDKMELIIQKSVELGVKEIIPIEMKRCVVKLNEKDKIKKVERWNKISEVAAKQSGRDVIPLISNVRNIKDIVENFEQYDVMLVCYENEENVFLKDVLKTIDKSNQKIRIGVVIGPEGGIDISEIDFLKQHGAKIVSLGNRILRTETVSLSILSIIMYEFERNDS